MQRIIIKTTCFNDEITQNQKFVYIGGKGASCQTREI